MWNPESPIYIKPRWNTDPLSWAWKFQRAATQAHVDRAAPVLRAPHLASRECYKEWAALWNNEFGLTERGLLMLCNTEHGLADETKAAEHARRLGMAAEVLTPSATAEIEPNLRMAIAGSVYFPADSHLAPERLMPVLEREVERAGVQVSYDTSVNGWRSTADHLEGLHTNRGTEDKADEYVVCAGIWSQQIARDLGIKIQMQAGKGYSLTMDDPAALPRVCSILSEARVAVTPMDGALRFAGTMELTGIDERINETRVRGIINSVARYFPDITRSQLMQTTARSGLRPCSPDGLPYVGRVSRFANL